jgi:hypothetical protein
MTNQPVDPPSTPCAGGVAAVLERIRREVRDLSDTLWAARRGDELMDIVAGGEALKSTIDALVLGAVNELEATQAAKPVGWASSQDFVTAVAGGHKGNGAARVRLAKALETTLLAPVGEAMRDGWLSSAKAQVIRRTIDELPGDPELRGRGVAFMLAEAKGLDATELARVGRHLVSRLDLDGEARREEKELDREERAAPPQSRPGDPVRRRRRMLDPWPRLGRGRREAPRRPAAALQAGPQQRPRLRPGIVRDSRMWSRRPRPS